MDLAAVLTLALSLLIAAQQPNVPSSIKTQAVEIANSAIAAAIAEQNTAPHAATSAPASAEPESEEPPPTAELTESVCLVQTVDEPMLPPDGASGPTFVRYETIIYVDRDFAPYFTDTGEYEDC